jgi:hypothetical protein
MDGGVRVSSEAADPSGPLGLDVRGARRCCSGSACATTRSACCGSSATSRSRSIRAGALPHALSYYAALGVERLRLEREGGACAGLREATS